MIKTVFVTIHGQESIGKKMADLNYNLSQEDYIEDCTFINLRYTKLWTVVNTLPWARSMTAKYIAARLETIKLKYPGARIIVIAHSNGTRATRIAMDMRLKPKKKWPQFKIDNLILLGCPIKRNYQWSRHPDTTVCNFVSSNDMVVWAARFYGMGTAGRSGFKYQGQNLQQFYVKWGHSGFMAHYGIISNYVRSIMRG
jgi:hypothetical protein